MKHLFLAFSMLILLVSSIGIAKDKDVQKETKTLHMTIEGMTCSLCSKKIQKELKKVCENATIDHKNGHGQCTYVVGKTTKDTVIKVVEDTGYTVTESHVE